jgi:hypothetical protein
MICRLVALFNSTADILAKFGGNFEVVLRAKPPKDQGDRIRLEKTESAGLSDGLNFIYGNKLGQHVTDMEVDCAG